MVGEGGFRATRKPPGYTTEYGINIYADNLRVQYLHNRSRTKAAVAGSQATCVAEALNVSEISGRRIPNDHEHPPMMAKLTVKHPGKTHIHFLSIANERLK